MNALALAGSEQGHGSPQGEQAALTDESTVSLNQIEGQIRASSIRQLVDLTDRHPDTTLAIIRGWMAG
jgi:flagellar M-ring protein FliF